MSQESLAFLVLRGNFGVSRLDSISIIPEWLKDSNFFSITKTSDELSIVSSEGSIPDNVKSEKGWRNLKIQGVLDFSLTGILASISITLANENISIFAISTFDTDYILVKEKDLDKAIEALEKAGHKVNFE